MNAREGYSHNKRMSVTENRFLFEAPNLMSPEFISHRASVGRETHGELP
jgi:hypothetical protein